MHGSRSVDVNLDLEVEYTMPLDNNVCGTARHVVKSSWDSSGKSSPLGIAWYEHVLYKAKLRTGKKGVTQVVPSDIS